jgi:molybdenum cofactor guanylyltransferase
LADKDITGLILAGGEGRRMGGADKGLLDYQGRPLVTHAIERLAPQVDTLLISANRNLDDYLDFGYPVVTDETDERLGPLAGLQAGLRACETPWLVACPCDCPKLPLDLVARLLAGAMENGSKLAIATTATGLQPTFLLCRRELLPVLGAALQAGERRVRGWCHCQRAVEVIFPDADAFANFNTPADLTLKQA